MAAEDPAVPTASEEAVHSEVELRRLERAKRFYEVKKSIVVAAARKKVKKWTDVFWWGGGTCTKYSLCDVRDKPNRKTLKNRLLFIKQHYKRWKNWKRKILINKCQLISESGSSCRDDCELETGFSNGMIGYNVPEELESLTEENEMDASSVNEDFTGRLPPNDDRRPRLDSSTCDLNLRVCDDGVTCIPDVGGELACLWGNVRCCHGVKRGRMCFQVKFLEELGVDHVPAGIAPVHGMRVGFSFGFQQPHLGREPMTYAYDSRGSLCDQGALVEGVEPFAPGDVITAYADLTGDAYIISFSKNNIHFHSCLSIPSSARGLPIFPHVATRSCSFQANFGNLSLLESRWCRPREGFTFIGKMSDDFLEKPTSLDARNFKAILMCGLPGSGKTHWVRRFLKESSDRKEFYCILGGSFVAEKMEVDGEEKKWACLANRCIHSLLANCSEVPRNYILDQTNVYKNSRKKKLEYFSRFDCKIVVVVPSDAEYKRRCEESRREGRLLPDAVLMEMKRNFRLPGRDETASVEFVEENEMAAKQIVKEYNSEGKSFYIRHLGLTCAPHEVSEKVTPFPKNSVDLETEDQPRSSTNFTKSDLAQETLHVMEADNQPKDSMNFDTSDSAPEAPRTMETGDQQENSTNFTKCDSAPEITHVMETSGSFKRHPSPPVEPIPAGVCDPEHVVPRQSKEPDISHAVAELPSPSSAKNNLTISQTASNNSFVARDQQQRAETKSYNFSEKTSAQTLPPGQVPSSGSIPTAVTGIGSSSKSKPPSTEQPIGPRQKNDVPPATEKQKASPGQKALPAAAATSTRHQSISQPNTSAVQTSASSVSNAASVGVLFPDNFQQMMQYPPPSYYQTPSQGYYHPYMPYASYHHPYYAMQYQQYYGYNYPLPSASTPLQSSAAPLESNPAMLQTNPAPLQPSTALLQSKSDPLQSTATPLQSTKTSLQSIAASKQSTATSFQSTATSFQSAATPFQSTKTSLQSTKTPLQSAATPFQSPKTPLQSTATSFQSTNTPLQSFKTPVQSTATSFQSTKTPLQSAPVSFCSNQQPVPQPSFNQQQHSGAQARPSNQFSFSYRPTQAKSQSVHSQAPINAAKSHPKPQYSPLSSTPSPMQRPPLQRPPLPPLLSLSHCPQNVRSVRTTPQKPAEAAKGQNPDVPLAKPRQAAVAPPRSTPHWSTLGRSSQWQSSETAARKENDWSSSSSSSFFPHSQPQQGQKQHWQQRQQEIRESPCGSSTSDVFQPPKGIPAAKDVKTNKFNEGQLLPPFGLKKRPNDLEDVGTDSKKAKLLTQVATKPSTSSFNCPVTSFSPSPSFSANVSQNQTTASNAPTHLTPPFTPRSTLSFANNSYNNFMNNSNIRNNNHGNYGKTNVMNHQANQYQKFQGNPQRDVYGESNYKISPKMGANIPRFPVKRPVQPMAEGGFQEKKFFPVETRFPADQRPFNNSGGYYQGRHCSQDLRFQNPPRVPSSRFRSPCPENYKVERYPNSKNSHDCSDTLNFSEHGYAPRHRQSGEPCFSRPFRPGPRPPLMADPFLKHDMHVEERPRDCNVWY